MFSYSVTWRWAYVGFFMLVKVVRNDGKVRRAGLFMSRSKALWNKRGPIKAWNGDVQRPTLTGSILVTNRLGGTFWHGYLREGKAYEA